MVGNDMLIKCYNLSKSYIFVHTCAKPIKHTSNIIKNVFFIQFSFRTMYRGQTECFDNLQLANGGLNNKSYKLSLNLH